MRMSSHFFGTPSSAARTDQHDREGAFALPTVLIAAVVMFILLISAVSAVSSIRVGLNNQYFNQLSQEAAESGVAYATFCLRTNNYTATWTGKYLTPATDCAGNANGKTPYIMDDGNGVRTTFSIGNVTVGAGGYVQVQAAGKVELVRTSSGLPWQSYQQSLSGIVRYSDTPKISGGAGWQSNGHMGAILSTDGQVYGFGANDQGQILQVLSPTTVTYPTKMALPSGVNRVKALKTSGQGATFICIIGDNNLIYCQGAPGAAENGLMYAQTGWQKFGANLSNVSFTDMSIKGYGPDGLCALTTAQDIYCAGENYYGSLGSNDTTYSIYKIDNAVKFNAAGAALSFTKVVMGDDITCGITTTSDLYCAGLNNYGQLGGPSTSGSGNGVYATPIKYPLPAGRKVQDVVSSYHGSSNTMHVLATDGTIWGSGNYNNGDLGYTTTTGSTGASQTPILFGGVSTHTPTPASTGISNYGTGSQIKNPTTGLCIDNAGGAATNGNTIQLYTCNDTPAQQWLYSVTNHQISNVGTGMCLDDPGNSSAHSSGSPLYLQLYTCNGTPAQQFTLNANGTITHTSSGLNVDPINAGSAGVGTRMELWDNNGCGCQVYTNDGTLNGWQQMIVGTNFFCALRQDSWSGAWCAGRNDYGQLANVSSSGNAFLGQCAATPNGTYTMTNVNLPNNAKVDLSKFSDEWKQQWLSFQAIATDGNVYGGGYNSNGKMGDGTSASTNCTTDKMNLPAAALPAKDLSARDQYTSYVLGSDGKVYAAGMNGNGQIGDGTTTDRLNPVEVQIPRSNFSY